jgi:hypothetical protein
MGFCFNRQLNLLHTASSPIVNKIKKFAQSRVISKATSQRDRRQGRRRRLSVEDFNFLESIGLKVRQRRRKQQIPIK